MARTAFIILMLAILPAALTASAEDRTLQFRLKPGANGAVCLGCHTDFAETVKKAYVHTPVKKNDCAGCHNPHTSSHGKLLAEEPNRICATCHGSVVPAKAASVHKPVAEGKCTGCHDPHASAFPKNLVREGNALCFGCHKSMEASVGKAKYRHAPVSRSCLACHLSHASQKNPTLLKGEVPGLCLGCHKVETPQFLKKHMNYRVGKSNCTSCHDPHGSDSPGMLLSTVHRPVQNRQCGQCHEEPSGDTIALKKNGMELCKSCHAGMISGVMEKNRQHWPLFSKKSCLSCHSPHAAPRKGLLRESTLTLCGSCHADTLKRQDHSATEHPPVKEGECSACHDPHGSDNPFFFIKPTIPDLCGTCHDWQKHSTHPVGEKFRDPRNKNLSVQCLSCHRSHGTEYKHLIPFSATTELCTQCHDQYKR
jgi:predicted CXXCH cytochrome family protein